MSAIERQQRFDAMEEELLAARDPDALEQIDAEALKDLGGDEATGISSSCAR